MTCNIDARGRAVRLITGLIMLLIALLLALLLIAGVITAPWVWFIIIGAALGGAFAVYEGWAGWCAVRAMGFRTPI